MKEELYNIKKDIYMDYFYGFYNKFMRVINILNIKKLLDLKNSQNNLQKFFDFLSRHIGTYKKAVQELVEGQREVTYNKDFKFQDGQTVKEKCDKFESKLKETLNIHNLYKKK
jgi:hypothetical protein